MNCRTRFPAAVLVLLLCAVACFGQAKSWKDIQIQKLPDFRPQEPKRIVLSNGLVILLQEDHELPLIDGQIKLHGGSISEPAGKAGLVQMYGEVWRTGGTKTRTGDELDDFLESRAALVETAGEQDSTGIQFSCLKQDFNDVFKAFVEVLREPEFRADKLDLVKREMYAVIARRNDNPTGIAGRESTKLVYGADNPYARVPEYTTVVSITREDLLKWHQSYVKPNNVLIGIVGDFDSKEMEARLREAFEGWGKGEVPSAPKISFPGPKPGIYAVAKPDVNQSQIRIVDLGIRRDHPDYYALSVMNEVLAGGFSSRLIQSLRTAKGLAYAVGGGMGAGFDHPGIFRLVMGTKSTSTVEAIQGLFEEVDKLVAAPPTDDEVQKSKDAILNSFIFNLDSPDKVLRERMTYEFYGYPADELERYRAAVEKVTAADVLRVAKKYIHKEKMAVLVVGNPAEMGKQLTELGPVTPLNVAIPPMPKEVQQQLGESEGGDQ